MCILFHLDLLGRTIDSAVKVLESRPRPRPFSPGSQPASCTQFPCQGGPDAAVSQVTASRAFFFRAPGPGNDRCPGCGRVVQNLECARCARSRGSSAHESARHAPTVCATARAARRTLEAGRAQAGDVAIGHPLDGRTAPPITSTAQAHSVFRACDTCAPVIKTGTRCRVRRTRHRPPPCRMPVPV